jgi:hypothetical protein
VESTHEKGQPTPSSERPRNPFWLVLALAALFAACSFLIANMEAITARFAPRQQAVFWKTAVRIRNVGREDWPGGHAQLNGKYLMEFGPVRQGSNIILRYNQFKFGEQTFNPTIEEPVEVIVAPRGQAPVVHHPRSR